MKQVRNSQNRDKIVSLKKKHGKNQEINPYFACSGIHLRKKCPFKRAEGFRCVNTRYIKTHCRTKMTKRQKKGKIIKITSSEEIGQMTMK